MSAYPNKQKIKHKSNGVGQPGGAQKCEAPPSVWPVPSKFPGRHGLGEGVSLQLSQTLTVGGHLPNTLPMAGQEAHPGGGNVKAYFRVSLAKSKGKRG